jgi:type IV secretory pathway VirB10-like protein
MSWKKSDGLHAALLVSLVLAAPGANAQELWKYIDKDGKVIYSDKPPKPGEKAEKVKHDPKANVIESPKIATPPPKKAEPVKDKTTVDQRIAAKVAERERLKKEVDAARDELEKARKALEEGSVATPEESIVVVGRTKTGAPTGVNTVNRKQEYYERVALLEANVKAAEKKLEDAETAYNRAR